MIRIVTLWITLIGISLASNQNYFIINHLVEKNEIILQPFTNERVIGDVYRYFVNDNLKSENVFVGKITENGKQGIWTRWWNNGEKKSKDTILILLSMVNGPNGWKMENNIQKYSITMVLLCI